MLAVGVDNIYILVQALQKDPPKSMSSVPKQVKAAASVICLGRIIYVGWGVLRQSGVFRGGPRVARILR